MRVALLLDPETHFARLRKRVGPWSAWYCADLVDALESLGHDVTLLHFGPDFANTTTLLLESKPHVVFNVANHVYGDRGCDLYAPALLEMLALRYTGSTARGLFLAGDKAQCKLVLAAAGIRVPRFLVYPENYPAGNRYLRYPVIIKPINGGGSEGLNSRSLALDVGQLEARLPSTHEKIGTPLIVEEYIEGRDFTLGLIGNGTPRVLTPWEWDYSRLLPGIPKIITERVKWDLAYQKRVGVRYRRSKLDSTSLRRVRQIAQKAFAALSLRDYASMDFRIDGDGAIHVLEVNANPGIMAGHGRFSDIALPNLVKSILSMAIRRPIPAVEYLGAALLKQL